MIVGSTPPASHPQAPGSGRGGIYSGHFLASLEISAHVSRQRGTLGNRQLFH